MLARSISTVGQKVVNRPPDASSLCLPSWSESPGEARRLITPSPAHVLPPHLAFHPLISPPKHSGHAVKDSKYKLPPSLPSTPPPLPPCTPPPLSVLRWPCKKQNTSYCLFLYVTLYNFSPPPPPFSLLLLYFCFWFHALVHCWLLNFLLATPVWFLSFFSYFLVLFCFLLFLRFAGQHKYKVGF